MTDHREAFEERAAILEYDAGMPRAKAEREAALVLCWACRKRTPRPTTTAGMCPTCTESGRVPLCA